MKKVRADLKKNRAEKEEKIKAIQKQVSSHRGVAAIVESRVMCVCAGVVLAEGGTKERGELERPG